MEDHNNGKAKATKEETSTANESGQIQTSQETLIADLRTLVERMSCEGRDQIFWRDELQAIVTAHS